VTNPVHIRILAINDFHGQLPDSDSVVDNDAVGGAATLAAYINKARAEDPGGTVLLSAGDAFGASPPESTLLNHESTMATLTAMGVNIATFGNHEFDRGLGETLRLILGGNPKKKKKKKKGGAHDPTPPPAPLAKSQAEPVWPGSPFPWVSANVVDKKTKKPIMPPYMIMEINGIKVGFIGAVTKDLKKVTVANGIKDIEVLDPAQAINKYVPELQAKGVHTIVAFVHEGGEPDKQGNVTGPIVSLVKHLDKEVDVVASGHSHKEYSTVIDGRIVTQGSSYAKAFSQIDLLVDPATGNPVAGTSQVIRNKEKGIAPDPTVAQLVQAFEQAVAPKTHRAVSKIPGAVTNEPNSSGESAMGTLIAEAQRRQAGADIGFMNSGGIRKSIPQGGMVTWGTLFNVQPFANRVIKLQMSGALVRATLEDSFGGGAGGHGLVQVAGLRVTYDSKRPVGHRVIKVVMDDGTPLQDSRTYTVAANSFIADGGDGFVHLPKGKRLGDRGVDLDALVNYLGAGLPVPTAPVGRLVDLSKGAAHHSE
jgi:5'-nucleotidase